MISKKQISNLIDNSFSKFYACWEILVAIKTHKETKDFIDKFINFQFTLAQTLMNLEKQYVKLNSEKNTLIKKKAILKQNWFRYRLKTIAGYQNAIKQSISIGKTLGDAFAWIFYNNERGFLSKHWKHQGNFHLPTGIGGYGELNFIKNVKIFQKHLVLYHGTTTFLRLGDASLLDLKTLKVVALIELKTVKKDHNTINIQASIIGSDLSDKFKKGTTKESIKVQTQLPQSMRYRLKRQIKKMRSSFDPVRGIDLPPRKWTQRRENGRIAINSQEVSNGAEETKAV